MNEQVKIEVALEILSMKIGMMANCEDESGLNRLLKMKHKIYKGNFEDIDLILKVYGNDIKQTFVNRK